MSIPNIPERTQDEVIVDLLESIALEETGLAHILNAEGEKIQAIVAGMNDDKYDTTEVIDLQNSVKSMIQTVIKKEMLLQFKLENIFDFSKGHNIPHIFSNTATVTAHFDNIEVTDTDIAYYHTESTTTNTTMYGNEVNLQ